MSRIAADLFLYYAANLYSQYSYNVAQLTAGKIISYNNSAGCK